jgi:transposase
LPKSVVQVDDANAQGEAVLRSKLSRGQLLKVFEKLAPCLVGREACASAHHWARELAALGHEVKLMPASIREAICKARQERSCRCEAICEAVNRPTSFGGLRSAKL